MPDFNSMPVYVDPVRVGLPFLLLAGLIVAEWRFTKRKTIRLASDVLFHSAVYLTLVSLLYETGNYDTAGFFLFPADQFVRLVHFDPFVGGLSVITATFIWGWLSAAVYPRLTLFLSRWVQPETKPGAFAFCCTLVGALFWLRYLFIYPLLLVPSLYLPLNIHRVSFSVGVMMINLCTLLFLVVLISALIARRRVGRLATLSLFFVVCPVIFIPLTTWLSNHSFGF